MEPSAAGAPTTMVNSATASLPTHVRWFRYASAASPLPLPLRWRQFRVRTADRWQRPLLGNQRERRARRRQGAPDIQRAVPVAVSGITNAVAISAGSFHACALLAAGTARCWGFNGDGQLGIGSVGAAAAHAGRGQRPLQRRRHREPGYSTRVRYWRTGRCVAGVRTPSVSSASVRSVDARSRRSR